MNSSLPDISRYYLDLGGLFEEVSGGSGFMNLGWLDDGQETVDVACSQKQLVRKVGVIGDFHRGMSLLDAGCGLGGPAALVSEEFGCRVTGLDPGLYQRERLKKVMKKRPAAFSPGVVAGDAMSMPFQARTFDRIYSIESAFHYGDKAGFVRESAFALKEKGLLVVADIVRKGGRRGRPLAGTLAGALAARQIYDVSQYRRAAENAGLRLLRVEDISDGVARSLRLWKRNFFGKYRVLRNSYSRMTLFKIGAALTLVPALAEFAPFRYSILVFGSHDGDS